MRRNFAARFGGAVILAFGFASAAMGQAFGVEMGAPLGALSAGPPLGSGIYDIKVPTPHPEFDSYVAKATDETGVCLVRGIGKIHDSDRFGTSIRGAFADLKQALQSRYGDGYTGDFLRDGAIWDGADEWVMALRQNERVYQAVWERKEGSTLPEGLNEIILSVNATGSDSAWIALQYRFENEASCSAIIDKASQSGL